MRNAARAPGAAVLIRKSCWSGCIQTARRGVTRSSWPPSATGSSMSCASRPGKLRTSFVKRCTTTKSLCSCERTKNVCVDRVAERRQQVAGSEVPTDGSPERPSRAPLRLRQPSGIRLQRVVGQCCRGRAHASRNSSHRRAGRLRFLHIHLHLPRLGACGTRHCRREGRARSTGFATRKR
jgi:hypothetical protein